MRRWFAVIPEKGFVHEMLPMTIPGKMQELLENATTYNIVGIPVYYDEKDRVWPTPIDGCYVAKTDN